MNKEEYRLNLESELINKYGLLISGMSLCHLLGFPSLPALRKGVERGVVEVPILSFKNRRGKYALAVDIADWLTETRFKSMENKK